MNDVQKPPQRILCARISADGKRLETRVADLSDDTEEPLAGWYWVASDPGDELALVQWEEQAKWNGLRLRRFLVD